MFGTYSDMPYLNIVVLLATAKQEVVLFSPPLRLATQAIGHNVAQGYYHVHGVSTDHDAEANDDDHESDLWAALTQAITEDQYARVHEICMSYCDLWDDFWTYQMQHHAA